MKQGEYLFENHTFMPVHNTWLDQRNHAVILSASILYLDVLIHNGIVNKFNLSREQVLQIVLALKCLKI